MNQQSDAHERYATWCQERDKYFRYVEANQVPIAQKAYDLTAIESRFREYNYLPPIIQSLDEVYSDSIESCLMVKLILIYDVADAPSVECLLGSAPKCLSQQVVEEKQVFQSATFKIPRSVVMQAESYSDGSIARLLDPSMSYIGGMNIPKFQFLIGLTPLSQLFGLNGVPSLRHPFHRFNHGIYIALNNGSQIYQVRKKEPCDWGVRPVYCPDLDEVFRSSWEANFARILNFKQIPWKYEPQMFSLKLEQHSTVYMPDFHLPDIGYVELKGKWDAAGLRKVMLFRQQYPDLPLYTIDGDMMMSLDELYSTKVPGWSKMRVAPVLARVPLKLSYSHVSKVHKHQLVILSPSSLNPEGVDAILLDGGVRIGALPDEWATVFHEKMSLGMDLYAYVSGSERSECVITVSRASADMSNIVVHPFLK
ncbi:MAG: hypothetical protein KGZ50_09455 [Peptococcaceae bacterium]|nr:hypothetical protein [Peptococcaceae bacterium]